MYPSRSLIYFAFTLALVGIRIQAQEIFTPEETAALKQLRNVVGNSIEEDFMNTDAYLIRWIRTKNMDARKASQALQDALKWRKENKINELVAAEPSPEMMRNAPYNTGGVTKKGEPVLEFLYGKWNVRKVSVSGQQAQFVRHWDQMLEKTTHRIHEIAKKNPNVRHFTNLCDLQGYNLRQHACLSCLPIVYEIVRNYEAYYPEYTNTFIIINTPKIFENMITFLKPIMSPALQKAMKTYGFDKREYSAAIQELVDPDQVTAAFGGTRKV